VVDVSEVDKITTLTVYGFVHITEKFGFSFIELAEVGDIIQAPVFDGVKRGQPITEYRPARVLENNRFEYLADD
jgi:hypothetical protein